MSYTQSHRYKLYLPSVIDESRDQLVSDVYMSSVPSKDDIISMLRSHHELDGYSAEFINNLRIERPDGWYYKKILVYSSSAIGQPLWKIIPAP